MANPVTWFEITGKDGEGLQRFYGDVFGWQYEKAPGPGNYGMLSAGDKGIGGGVGDPQAYLDKVEQHGGKTVMPVTEVPNMVTFALFSDPEGHIVGVFKSRG